MSFFIGIAGHWRLGVYTDREVEDSWSFGIVTTRFASSLASSAEMERKGSRVVRGSWQKKREVTRELAEQDKRLLLMVSRWWKRCRRAMV